MAGMNAELAIFPPTPFSISSPFSKNPSPSTPTTSRPTRNTNRAASFSFLPRKPQHSLALSKSPLYQTSTPSSTGNSEKSQTYVAAMQSSSPAAVTTSPLSPPTSSPAPLPKGIANLRHKPSFRIFGHAASDTPSVSKAKRNRLVRKKVSEPTFEIVTPSKPQTKEVSHDETLQEEAQVAIGEASVIPELEVTPAAAVNSPTGDIQTGAAKATNDLGSKVGSENLDSPDDTSSSQTKRWSHAPLLPELDFGVTSTESNPLFNPATHNSPPEAKISLSVLPRTAYNRTYVPITSTDPTKLTYRCDVHASDSASQLTIEQACQTLVHSAGGQILNSYFYPGGFLYTLPPGITEPIATCEIPVPEAKIVVENCRSLPEPRFDGLRMHPVGGMLGGSVTSAGNTGMAGKLSKRRKMENLRAQKGAANESLKAELGKVGQKDEKNETVNGAEIANKQSLKSASESGGGISLSSFKSFGRLRRGASEDTEVGAKTSAMMNGMQSLQNINSNEKRFAIVAASSVSDDDSGAEEWESVQSEWYE
ncbi:hypothetical protein Q7P37_003830 [Cladosporium fusiforme]